MTDEADILLINATVLTMDRELSFSIQGRLL